MADINITKESRQFYAMIALLKCAEAIGDYLLTTPEKTVHREVKSEMKRMFRAINYFQREIVRDIPAKDLELWNKDWQRDYLAFSAIFEFMSDMNDDQRAVLEEFAGELSKGNVEVQLKQTA